MTTPTDAALAERARAGEDAAFELLMRRHKSWMYRFVRRYVNNADDAYDVLQDAFFSAWLALASYDPSRPFELWLRRITLNKCRDRWRYTVVRRALFGNPGPEAATDDIPDMAANPEREAAAEQQVRLLEHSIASLPRALKEPLLLTVLEGLSHKEAAEVLGLNAKAIEMRIYRARARLNALMEHSGTASAQEGQARRADQE